jgi:hypothetical protein
MEILRFDDGGTLSHPRKKSSRGLLFVGLVATLFGISSAFASSTIAINGNAPIALGQGVTAVTACDNAISIVPTTEMTVEAGTPTFFMTNLAINDIDAIAQDATTGLGCGGKIFDIQIFNESNTPYTCEQLKANANIYESGNPTPYTLDCVSLNKLSFQVASADSYRNYTISFDKAPATISYVTLVTR